MQRADLRWSARHCGRGFSGHPGIAPRAWLGLCGVVSLKERYFPKLIDRDGGFKCFYCKQELSMKRLSFDHLNNNRADNRMENLVLCHQSCNIKKISHLDYQIMASQKLKGNEEEFSVSERKTEKTDFDSNSEIGINVGTYEIVETYLNQEIQNGGHVKFNDALYSIVYICKQRTGHGSEPAVRRHLNTLTALIAPFELKKNDAKEKIIVRREK